MMHKYWCHKSEALKAIVKKSNYFHSGPGFPTHNTCGTIFFGQCALSLKHYLGGVLATFQPNNIPLRTKATIHQVTTMLATSEKCPISRYQWLAGG